MARIDSLNILGDPSGKLALEEKYGPVIENISTQLISSRIKNQELSGDPSTGTLVAKRFVNAKSANYGSARTAAKGAYVKGKEVIVAINVDKEIIEEVENKDTLMLGVDGLINKRVANHRNVMALDLEKAFFAAAETAATAVDVAAISGVNAKLDAAINALKTVKNDYVEGVNDEDIQVTLNVAAFTALRQYLDGVQNANVNTGERAFGYFHGIKVEENINQTEQCLIQRIESIAQPVKVSICNQGKIPLSDAYAFGIFYYYGTQVVTPDLIFKATLISTPETTTPETETPETPETETPETPETETPETPETTTP